MNGLRIVSDSLSRPKNSWKNKIWQNPIVAEVPEIWEAVAAKDHYNLREMYEADKGIETEATGSDLNISQNGSACKKIGDRYDIHSDRMDP